MTKNGIMKALVTCTIALMALISACNDPATTTTTTVVTKDAGTDAGTQIDAGTDAGTDAGVAVQSQIGEGCTATTPATQKGTCTGDATTCLSTPAALKVFPGGFCTKNCTVDADCGKNGSVQNVCVDLNETTSLCFRGCDTTVSGSCGRDGKYRCTADEGQTKGVCTADCGKNNGMCTGNTSCNTTTGNCEGTIANSLQCDPNAANECIPKNRCVGDTDLPAGGFCVQTPCSATAPCAAGLTCEAVSATTSICVKACTVEGDTASCAAGLSCQGSKNAAGTFEGVCAPDCRVAEREGMCAITKECKTGAGSTGACTRKVGTLVEGTACNLDDDQCDANTICYGTEAANAKCVKNCKIEANACAATASCLTVSSDGSACFEKCDIATTPTTCATPKTCQKIESGTEQGYCDFEQPKGTVDQGGTCGTATTLCKDGLSCLTTSSGAATCLTECSTSATLCPAGTQCNVTLQGDASKKFCSATPVGTGGQGATCGGTAGACKAGFSCLVASSGAATGTCNKECTADATTCEAGTTCKVQTQAGQKFCAP